MLSFLQYLLALIIGSYAVTPAGTPAPAPDVAGIVLTISAFGLLAATTGILAVRLTRQGDDRAVARYTFALAAGRVVALAAYWIVAQQLDGREIPHALGIDDWIFVPHVVRLLPFAFLLLLLRAGFHPVGAHLELEPPSLPRTWWGELKLSGLALGPLLPLLVAWDIVYDADPASPLGAARQVLDASPLAQALLSLLLLLGAIVAMPFAMRVLMRAKPLPAGPLRTRLEAYAGRIDLKAREILVWPTGGEVINAAVIGAFPRLRYVVLTDALVETLRPEEVEAVFAHEAGHAKRGHVLLFFGFTMVLVLSSFAPDVLGVGALLSRLHPLVRTIVTVLAFVGVVFGWISRRFEQEADVFGIDTLPPVEGGDAAQHPFALALERIAIETPGIREMNGWRHFSIADRVRFVRDYVGDAAVRARYRRGIRLLRGTLVAAIAAISLLALANVPQEAARARTLWATLRTPRAQLLLPLRAATLPATPRLRARRFLEAALLAQRGGRPDDALRWLRQAASLAPDDAFVLSVYAQALEDAGRPLGARIAWSDLLATEGAPEPLRERARAALDTAPRDGD